MANRRKAKAARTTVVERRLGRAALLRGTALQAVFGLAFVAPAMAQPAPSARPQGGQVVAGSASIANSASTTTVNQSSNRAAVNWQSFSVGRDQAVNFVQPGTSSVTLNRVVGPDPSAIAGRISANGQIVLTNPNGVVFHQGSQVNAQSVIVSTAGISNQNFMAGRMAFDRPGKPDARIENAGTITVKQAGLAALVAPSVQNSGVINARMGQVVLAGAAAHTLDMYGDGLVSIDVTRAVRQAPRGPDGRPVTALVTNTGVIQADGGVVQLTAKAADGVVQDLVRAGGRIQANTVGNQAGRIEITGTGGSVVIEGRVAADGRGPGAAGGTVVLNGSEATTVAAGARVSANGTAGGGTVAVGTTLARARALGPAPTGTSQRVTVAAGAKVSADATGTGNGGRVTILSTKTTVVDGATSARGGQRGGDGGTVELSGEQGFRLTGTADTAAPRGALGTIVLDPRDLLITNTPGGNPNLPPGGTDPNIGAGTGGTTTDAYVTPGQIQALTGNVRLQATRDLTVANAVTYLNGSLTLEAGRNLTVGAVALSSAGTMTLSAATPTIAGYDPAGTLTVLGDLAAARIALNAGSGGIALAGTVNASAGGGLVTFNTGGTVQQTGGSVITGSLNGTVGRLLLTQASNRIAVVGNDTTTGLTATGDTVAIASSVPLTIGQSGVVTTNNGINLPIAGLVSIQADTLTLLSAAGRPALVSGGTVSLQPLTSGRGITITTSAKPTNALALTAAEAGLVVAPALELKGTGNSAVTFGQAGDGRIDLASSGRLSQVALATTGTVQQNAPVTLPALVGTAGAVFLNNTANVIPTVFSLSATGPINVATSGDLVLGNTVSAGNSLFLRAGGNLTVPAGTTASSTTFTDLTANNGGATPAAALVMAGTVTAGSGATLNAGTGGIALSGTVNAPAFGVYTGGAVSQTVGTITTASLEGQVGSLSLLSPANAISGIARGGFVQLRITGAAGDATVVTQSALRIGSPSVAGGLFVPTGRTITLVTDGLTLDPSSNGARTVNAPGGTFALSPYTAGGTILVTSGTKPTTGLSLSTGDLGQIAATTLQLGSLTTGAITLGRAGETIDLGVPGIDNLRLLSAGAVTQGGPLAVGGTVSGQAASLDLSYATATDSNFIRGLAGFTTTSGDLLLHTSSQLAVSGTVNAAGGTRTVFLSSGNDNGESGTGTSMALTANITGSTVNLNSLSGAASVSGGITQTSGIITADTLTGAGNFIRLTGANQVSALGDLASYADTAVTTVRALAINGAVSTETSSLTLNAAGITQGAAGSVSTPRLSGSSSAATVLTNRTNLVAGVDGFTQSAGDFTLVSGSAQIQLGETTLSAPAGSITLVADRVLAPLSLGGGLSAPTGNVTLAPFTAGRRIELIGNTAADPGSLSIGQRLLSRITTTRLNLGDANSTGAINIANAGETIDLTGRAATLGLRTTGAVTEGVSPAGQNGGGTLGLTVGTVTGSVGNLALGAAGNRIAAVTDLVAAQSLAVQSAVALTANGTVSANATTGTLSLASSNALTTLAALSARNVTLGATGGALSLQGGSLVAGGTLTLNAPAQAITRTGTTISADTLTGTAASAALGGAGISVATLGPFTTTGGFTLTDARSLTVAGPVSAGTVSLTVSGDLALPGAVTATGGTSQLIATGAITQPATGAVTFSTLSGSAGSVSLLGANAIGTLAAFATTNDFTLNTNTAMTVAGPFSATTASLSTGGALTLTGPLTVSGLLLEARGAAVTQTAAGVVTAGTLAVRGASATLNAANSVGALGQVSTAGAFAFTDTRSLSVTGPVNAGSATLAVTGNLGFAGSVAVTNALTLSVSGAVTQTAPIAAGTLTGTAGSVVLDQVNTVGTLGAFAANGGFTLGNGQSLTVTGPVSGTGVSLNVTGDLALNGAVTTPGTASLVASGAITQNGGGGITANTLSGSAALAQLNAGNAIDVLGAFTTTGAFTLQDGRALTVAGPVSAGSVDLGIAGNLTFAGNLVTPGRLGVSVAGGVFQSAGTVVAGTLEGNAASVTMGDGNGIDVLGSLTTPGAFALTNARSLSVAGPLTTGSGSLTVTGDLVLAGVVGTDPGQTLNLSVSGAITQPAGTLAIGRLTGSAASATLDRTNTVFTLGPFATTGGFTLTDQVALNVAGPFSAANAALTINGGDLAFSGPVTVPGTLNLSVTGSVTQPGGTLTVGTLAGRASIATLNGAGNAVTTLGGFTTDGAFTLADGRSLTVAGPVSAAAASLSVAGDLVFAGNLATPGALTLNVTGGVSQTGGTLNANSLAGSAGSVALGRANAVATLGTFTTTGGFSLTDARSLTVAGPLSAATASLGVTGDLVLNAAVTVAGTLTLSATGAITQPGGIITAGTLAGSATAASFGQANAVAGLGAFTTTGAFALTDARSLTLSGPFSAGDATLAVTGDLVFAGNLVTRSLTLAVSGAVTQPGGAIIANRLTGSAGSVALTGPNDVSYVDRFTTKGAFALTDTRSVTVGGGLSASDATLAVTGDLRLFDTLTVPGTLTLSATGAITQPFGTINAGTLSGTAGTATLTAGNSVATLRDFAVAGDLALTDVRDLALAGTVSAANARLAVTGNLVSTGTVAVPGALTLAVSGDVTQTAGSIGAGTLTGSARSVALGGPNAVSTLGNFVTTGDFALTTARTLTIGGTLGAANGSLTVAGDLVLNGTVSARSSLALNATGAITQPGGTITVPSLTGSAASASLLQTNAVAALGAFGTTGRFALVNGGVLNVTGPVSGSDVALTAGGNMVLSGAVNGRSSVTLVSGGTIVEQGGSIATPTLSGSALGATMNGANGVASLGSFSTGRGDFALTDTRGLTVNGPLTAGAVGLNVAGDLVLNGTVLASGPLTLSVQGAVSQTGGSVTAASLNGTAGGFSLQQRGNVIPVLGAFSSRGDFALADSVPVTVAGAVVVGNGRTLTLSADAPTLGRAGSLSAPGGTVALTEYGTGVGITLGGGAGIAEDPRISADRLTIGSATGGPIAITGAFNLANTPVLDLQSGGAITETGAGAIRVATLTGRAASAALGGANQVGTLGDFSARDGFALNNAGALNVAGSLSGGNVTLAADGDMALRGAITTGGTLTLRATGTITQPDGSITAGAVTGSATAAFIDRRANRVAELAGFTTTGDFTFTDGRSLVVSAPVDPNVVTLNVDGTLTLNSSVTGGTVVLNATGAIVTGANGRVEAGTLTGGAESAALGGANRVDTLGDFATRTGFAFGNIGALTVSGTVADRGTSVSIGTTGPLVLTGSVVAPTVALRSEAGIRQAAGSINADTLVLAARGDIATAGRVVAGTATVTSPGTVSQQGGTVTLGRLGGTVGNLDLGRGGAASIGEIGNISASNSLVVVDQSPLRLFGTVSAPVLQVTATGTMTLDNTAIRTDGAPRSVQAGAQPAAGGSTLSVLPGTNGTATLQQLGTTTVAPLNGGIATLRLQLPPSGGQLVLNNLEAPQADLVFAVGAGTARGALVANNLTYLGNGGNARLTGEVRERSGTLAAQISEASPQSSDSYTLNGCAIGAFSCTPDTLMLFNTTAAIASILRPDILTLDVLDLSVTRDRDDPTLLLPNISERDY